MVSVNMRVRNDRERKKEKYENSGKSGYANVIDRAFVSGQSSLFLAIPNIVLTRICMEIE